MGLPLVDTSTELKVIQCGTCGVWHALPQAMFDACYREGGFWHCPNGHSRGYGKGTTQANLEQAQKALAEEKKRHQATLSRLNEESHTRIKLEKKMTRQKKRIAAGVCPCCNRTFQQLARHIKTKHPDFGDNKP